MRKLAAVSLVLPLVLSGCLVPKKRLTEKTAEADSCYEALKKENARKKELAQAMADLQSKLSALATERAKLAEEKGSMESTLTDLEGEVARQIEEVQRLSEEKSKLEAEKEALEAKTETYDELVSSLKREMEDKLIEVKQQGSRVTVSMSDRILFDSGSTVIKDRGQEALTKIADVLKKVSDRRIDVEGHTDTVPITGKLAEKFPTNWELSTARATNVVRYLQDHGVQPGSMAAVGKSQYWPVSSNATPAGRQLNRRIEIVLTPMDEGKS